MAKITYKETGSIFEEDAEALVNTVNCDGFMGKGIALKFKCAYRKNFDEYVDRCKRGEMRPGRVFVFPIRNPELDKKKLRYIINFPTKRHWRGKSKMEDIQSGLDSLVKKIGEHEIRSIALPALGCGLGGLNWDEVRQQIEEALGKLEDVKVTVFEPRPPEREAMGADSQPES